MIEWIVSGIVAVKCKSPKVMILPFALSGMKFIKRWVNELSAKDDISECEIKQEESRTDRMKKISNDFRNLADKIDEQIKELDDIPDEGIADIEDAVNEESVEMSDEETEKFEDFLQ